MERKKLLPIAALALVMLMSLTAVTANGATTQTLTLEPNKLTTLVLPLTAGTPFKGSFVLNTTAIIRFSVTDPKGKPIIDSRFVNTSASFEFTAEEEGNYNLIFDNSGGNLPLTATLTYDTGGPLSPLVFIPVGITVVLSIVLVIYVYRNRKKSKSEH